MIFNKQYILLGTVVIISSCIASLVVRGMHKVNNCVVHVDSSFSSSFSDLVSARVQQLSHERPCSLFSQLQKEYPCIKSISCRYDPCHTMTVYIGAATPVLQLNKEHLILENNICVDAHWYRASCLPIACITAPSNACVRSLVTFFDQLPAALSQRFMCEWHTDYDIRLHDTIHKNSVLVTRIDMVPTFQTVNAYDKIIDDLKKYTVGDEHKNEKWIADARFDNQLIFSTQKRGADYENRSV